MRYGQPKPKEPRFHGYDGNKEFAVTHPKYGYCRVFAPDEQAAIIPAAEKWGRSWTDYEFYSQCTATKI